MTLDGTVLHCSEDADTLPALLEAGEIDQLEVTLQPKLIGNDHPKLTLSSSRQFELQSLVRDQGTVRLSYVSLKC